MNEESYPFNSIEQIFVFEFGSISPNKTIKKLAEISLVDYENQIFSIALLDILPGNTLSDLTVRNNEAREFLKRIDISQLEELIARKRQSK